MATAAHLIRRFFGWKEEAAHNSECVSPIKGTTAHSLSQLMYREEDGSNVAASKVSSSGAPSKAGSSFQITPDVAPLTGRTELLSPGFFQELHGFNSSFSSESEDEDEDEYEDEDEEMQRHKAAFLASEGDTGSSQMWAPAIKMGSWDTVMSEDEGAMEVNSSQDLGLGLSLRQGWRRRHQRRISGEHRKGWGELQHGILVASSDQGGDDDDDSLERDRSAGAIIFQPGDVTGVCRRLDSISCCSPCTPDTSFGRESFTKAGSPEGHATRSPHHFYLDDAKDILDWSSSGSDEDSVSDSEGHHTGNTSAELLFEPDEELQQVLRKELAESGRLPSGGKEACESSEMHESSEVRESSEMHESSEMREGDEVSSNGSVGSWSYTEDSCDDEWLDLGDLPLAFNEEARQGRKSTAGLGSCDLGGMSEGLPPGVNTGRRRSSTASLPPGVNPGRRRSSAASEATFASGLGEVSSRYSAASVIPGMDSDDEEEELARRALARKTGAQGKLLRQWGDDAVTNKGLMDTEGEVVASGGVELVVPGLTYDQLQEQRYWVAEEYRSSLPTPRNAVEKVAVCAWSKASDPLLERLNYSVMLYEQPLALPGVCTHNAHP
ncbi:unnamed protein product [Chrysoparadoxa australica]